MQKVFLVLLIVVVWWVLLTFLKPDTTKQIESSIWIWWVTDSIKWARDNFNNTITDIPSIDTLKETYWEAYSWAIDIKDTITWWVKTTKDTIDDVRSTLSGAQNTYNEAKNTLNEAKETINKTTETFNKLKWTVSEVEKLWEGIKWIVDTDILE